MEQEASLQRTPTWAVAVVCAIFITISVLLERAIHLLSEFLKRRKKRMLNQALCQIKSDLMLLGFISLSLTVTQKPISKICIPRSFEDSFLPCKGTTLLGGIIEEASCQKKGKISLVSRKGLNELQTLAFSLAFFHVISCVLTVGLGIAKMKKWEAWEAETRTLDYQFSNDPRRFKLARQTTFGRRHLKAWSDHSLLLWPVCLLRQFAGSISKADYFALRRGFIMAHFGQERSFDFHRFLRRSLDADFVKVVGIRLWIWVFSTFFIFFHAYVFRNYLWLPFTPLLIILIVGTKLEVIITRMCRESTDLTVVSGTLLVKPHNDLFWFGRPQWILHLVHLVLFQNSFQLAFFSWTWYKFGLRSCFHRQTEDIVIRIAMAILVQLLCGYVTLPLYALVTQMGSSMKPAVFTDGVAAGLRSWHRTAKQSIAVRTTAPTTPSARPSTSNTVEVNTSSAPSSVTVGTSVPDTPTRSPEVEGKSAETGHIAEIVEEETDAKNNNTEETYNGEISFGW